MFGFDWTGDGKVDAVDDLLTMELLGMLDSSDHDLLEDDLLADDDGWDDDRDDDGGDGDD